MLQGQALHGLLTSGLLHSGLLPMLCSADGISNAGQWLELTSGPLILLVTYAAAAGGAAVAQLMLGTTPTAISGAGAVTGLYAALAVAGLTDRRGTLPVFTLRGIIYAALNLGLALLQPAIGLACLAGGALGGAIIAPIGPAVARGVSLTLGVPVLLVLGGLRLAWQLVMALVVITGAFVLATLRAVMEAVKAVRNL